MLPILPLLLILLFPGVAGPRAEMRLETGTSIERRMVAALVETVRQEAEREALASTAALVPVRSEIAPVGVREAELAIRESDRVRDGPVA